MTNLEIETDSTTSRDMARPIRNVRWARARKRTSAQLRGAATRKVLELWSCERQLQTSATEVDARLDLAQRISAARGPTICFEDLKLSATGSLIEYDDEVETEKRRCLRVMKTLRY